ncbi:hypothetical protein OIU89_18850 [Escherichia coli]|nr:hypothetical protein [Escherichia coli]
MRDSSFLSLRDTYGHTRVVELLRQMPRRSARSDSWQPDAACVV